MGKLAIDRVQLEITIKNDEARRQTSELKEKVSQLKKELNKLHKAGKQETQEYADKLISLKKVQKEYDQVIDKIGLTGLSMKELTEKRRELNAVLKNISPDNNAYDKYQNKLNEVTERIKELRIKAKLAGTSLEELAKDTDLAKFSVNELKKRQAQLNIALNDADPKSERFKKFELQLNKTNTQIQKLTSGSRAMGSSIGRMADKFNRFAAIGAGVIGVITGVVFSMQQFIQGNKGLSDSEADVIKTTGLTKKEIRELQSDFKTLNTRTPRKELMKLAEDAGRLGKKTKAEIFQFVEAGNIIKTALGDDLGEGAIKQIGKLTDTFKVSKKTGKEYKDAMLSVGSAVNTVASSSNAEAEFMVDFSKRLSGVASQANISIQSILGYGSTLDSLGQTSELSSTAVNKVLVDMFRKPADYAEIAGIKTTEFIELLNKDANEAFIKMLEGLNGNSKGFATMVKKMDDAGISGENATKVLASLAGNTKKIREQQTIANDAFDNGTSVIDEYNTKNNNLAGNLEKIGKALHRIFINSAITGAIEKVVGYFAKWTEIDIISKIKKEQKEVNVLAVELSNTNTSSKRRYEILNKLKSINPEITKGLNAESINYDILTENVNKYNDSVVKRIMIEKLSKEEKEEASKLADAKMKAAETEYEANKLIQKILKDNALQADDFDTKIKKSIDVLNTQMKNTKQYGHSVFAGEHLTKTETPQYKNLRIQLESLINAQVKLKEATKDANAAGKKQEDFSKRMSELRKLLKIDTPEASNEISEGSEKIINGVLMVYKGGKWEKKKIKTTPPSPNLNSEKEQKKSNLDEIREIKLQYYAKLLNDEIKKNELEKEKALENLRDKIKDKKGHINESLKQTAEFKEAEENIIKFYKKKEEIILKNQEEKKYKTNEESLNKILQDEKIKLEEKIQNIKSYYNLGLISKEMFNEKTIELEQSLNNSLMSLKKDYNMMPEQDKRASDLLLLEGLLNAELQLNINNEEEKIRIKKQYAQMRHAIETEMSEKEKRELQKKGEIYKQYTDIISGHMEKWTSGEKASFKDFSKDILYVALKALKAKTQIAVAGVTIESLASTESIATFGAAGLAKAAVLVGLIEAAFAGVKGVVKQLNTGKYPVIGENDGKTYYPQVKKKADTGIILNPVLVAEEPEAVIDHKTLYNPDTDNLGMTVMDHFNAIKAIKFDKAFSVPQMAAGKYTAYNINNETNNQTQEDIPNNGDLIQTAQIIDVLNKLNEKLSTPIKADVNYFEFQEVNESMKDINNSVSS